MCVCGTVCVTVVSAGKSDDIDDGDDGDGDDGDDDDVETAGDGTIPRIDTAVCLLKQPTSTPSLVESGMAKQLVVDEGEQSCDR